MVLAVWGPEHLTWAFLPKRDFSTYLRSAKVFGILGFVPKESWGFFGFFLLTVMLCLHLNPNPAQGDFKLNQNQITVTVQSSFTI